MRWSDEVEEMERAQRTADRMTRDGDQGEVSERAPELALSLDLVRDILAARGIASYVEQTGGGTATLLVGGLDADGRARVLVGPGWFEGPGWSNAFSAKADTAIGPDDDGVADPTYTDYGWTEDNVADEVDAWLIALADQS